MRTILRKKLQAPVLHTRKPQSVNPLRSQLRLALPTLQKFRPSTRNAQFPRLDDLGLKHDLGALPPHLRPQRLPRQHRAGKSDLDVLERAIRLINVLARDPKETQAVQDRRLEAADLRELRINVQRIPIAIEAV